MSDRITKNTNIIGVKPVINGTRITIDIIKKFYENQSIEDILEIYPKLKKKYVEAALDYNG